jgi:hypothetical protein
MFPMSSRTSIVSLVLIRHKHCHHRTLKFLIGQSFKTSSQEPKKGLGWNLVHMFLLMLLASVGTWVRIGSSKWPPSEVKFLKKKLEVWKVNRLTTNWPFARWVKMKTNWHIFCQIISNFIRVRIFIFTRLGRTEYLFSLHRSKESW